MGGGGGRGRESRFGRKGFKGTGCLTASFVQHAADKDQSKKRSIRDYDFKCLFD